MGLTQDIINAKVEGLKKDAETAGASREEIDNIKETESITAEAELMTKAISNLLTNAKEAPFLIASFA